MINYLPTQKNTTIQPEGVWPAQFLFEMVCKYEDTTQERFLEIEPNPTTIILTTDKKLLERVIGQMIMMGLQATLPGESVRLGFVVDRGHIVFQIYYPHNPENIDLRHIKYVAESYLYGEVGYKVTKQGGCVVAASFPINWQG